MTGPERFPVSLVSMCASDLELPEWVQEGVGGDSPSWMSASRLIEFQPTLHFSEVSVWICSHCLCVYDGAHFRPYRSGLVDTLQPSYGPIHPDTYAHRHTHTHTHTHTHICPDTHICRQTHTHIHTQILYTHLSVSTTFKATP